MPPLNVFLDTNVFSRDPGRTSKAISTLGRICTKGYVQLHLSTIVVREAVSQDDEHFTTTLAAIRHGIKKLGTHDTSAASRAISKLEESLEKVEAKLLGHADT